MGNEKGIGHNELEYLHSLQTNICNQGLRHCEGWSEWFSTTCWLVWRRRNEWIYDNKLTSNDLLTAKATSIISSMSQARKKLKGVNISGQPLQNRDGQWEPPIHGWLKLNVVGACSRTQDVASGGVLRDEHGNFLSGFMYRATQQTDSLNAEFRAMLLGLKLAWYKDARKLLVESDAAEFIRLFQEDDVREHPGVDVITEVREMLAREWEVEANQILRSANKIECGNRACEVDSLVQIVTNA